MTVKEMEIALKAIMKSLAMIEREGLKDEQARQEVARLVGELWELTGKVGAYYRDKYELDRPTPYLLEKGRQIFEMREQGFSLKEICKKLDVNRGNYYHLLVEYQHYMRKHGGET